jgi:hypothetical protein
MIDLKVLSAGAGLALSAGAWTASAATAIPYAPILGAQPAYREIKDWVLACDNTHACFAKYDAADDGPGGGGYLSVAREAGPAGALVVTLEGDQENSVLPGPGGPRLDGRPLAGYAWAKDAKAGTWTLKGDAALRFVRAIGNGSKLTYSAAKAAPYVSLSGMKAALLAMDENQGRLGGVTALARAGPQPASAAPAAPLLPVVYARPVKDDLPNAAAFAAAVRKAAAKVLDDHACDADQASRDEAHALDAANAIVILGCMEAAYQGSLLAFEAPRNAPGKARQLFMPLEPRLDSKDSTNSDGEYTEGAWDPKTAAFTQSAKGRGVADCGSSTTWTWNGQAFQLSDYNALARCGGGPPGDWPTIYRTRVVNR